MARFWPRKDAMTSITRVVLAAVAVTWLSGAARGGAGTTGRWRRAHRIPVAARHAGPVRGAVSHQLGDAGGRHHLRPGSARADAGPARRSAFSRSGRTRQPAPIRPGAGLRAAAAPHPRRPQPAAVDVRPPPAGAVRAVGAGLGVVVLGLDQGRADRDGPRHAARVGALRVPAPQSHAVVVLRLAGLDPGRAAAHLHRPDLHRAAVRHVRAARTTPAGAGP